MPPGAWRCSRDHCMEFTRTAAWRAYCRCLDWQGKPIPGCQAKGPDVPLPKLTCYKKVTGGRRTITMDACMDLRDRDRNWSWTDCFCCCSGGGDDPEIRISEDEARPAHDLDVSDTVQSASIERLGGQLSVTWRPVNVSFSDGVSAGEDGHEVVIIRYGEGCEMRATPDQLFLMSDGQLKP